MEQFKFKTQLPKVITGTDEAYRKKLRNPPSRETIKKAVRAFAPHYDEWMKGHHDIATSMIREYNFNGSLGRIIVDVGCGTGVLTRGLVFSRCYQILDALRARGEGMVVPLPFRFICIDMSSEMLAKAREGIAGIMHDFQKNIRFVRVDWEGPKRSPLENDFEFVSDDKILKLLFKEKEMMEVEFVCKEVSKLREVMMWGEMDSVILSYVMHWFRGIEGKMEALKAVYEAMAPSGRLISIEEYPLVVRSDLHKKDRRIRKLAQMIEKATTVIPMPHMIELFRKAGFHGGGEMNRLEKRIDEYHVMYGNVYAKNPRE